jgi:hypothetical protein
MVYSPHQQFRMFAQTVEDREVVCTEASAPALTPVHLLRERRQRVHQRIQLIKQAAVGTAVTHKQIF